MERRLTAILAADVVGYSRLMGQDETSTLTELQRHRDEIFDPKAAQHHGRTVKLMGDGTLMEFASVVDAVTFAVDLQTAMAERNAGIPEDRRIIYRVGINLGDIVHQDDDIYGDGVNVAARLEGLAEPGGICISRSARDQVRDKLDLTLDDQGEVEIKNIARPVRVFKVIIDDKAQALATPVVALEQPTKTNRSLIYAAALVSGLVLVAGLAWWQPWAPDFEPADKAQMALALPDKPSIAVLPFDNLSGDKEQEYFADGMTDDLLTGLSRLSGLFVISRNTSFTYKGTPVKIRQVAEDLGVRYVLEGSVRRAGTKVRINAQLIDALTGYHVWAKKYDREMTDVFQLQDEVVGNIVAAMAHNLRGRKTAAPKETDSTEAYDAFLQGREYFRTPDPKNTAKAIDYFNKAIDLDPEYDRARAALAGAYYQVYDSSWADKVGISTTETFELAKRHLARALNNPTAEAYRTSAEMILKDGKHATALGEIDKAIALDGNDPDNYVVKSYIQVYASQAGQAEENVRLAMRLNPKYPPQYLRQLGRSLYHQGRYKAAAEVFERAVKRQPDYDFNYPYLAASYGQLNRLDEAKVALARYAGLRKGSEGGLFTVQGMGDWTPFAGKTDLENLRDGLRKAGVPEGAAPEVTEADYKSLISKEGGKFTVKGAPMIDLAKAKALQEVGELFVDVRSGGYPRGHIPGAVWLDLKTKLTRNSLAEHAKLDQTIVFYCDGFYCYKSADACAKALTWGYTSVFYYAGGMPEWKQAGYPVVTD